jgi:hypothetical protein
MEERMPRSRVETEKGNNMPSTLDEYMQTVDSDEGMQTRRDVVRCEVGGRALERGCHLIGSPITDAAYPRKSAVCRM